ncbi:hypothetical protein JAAARDRAFT_36281 [Jaapia argillacea MUCL 33604]|uniref:Uncharacterized protein n=1 Tax=Jaapia argillacea MUCL 33604 TaxID=933084 RepID=A0A067PSK0_9AGAM|nr:hypothetical protein JAAARDRAFT_36281 [Jaapia argillacea MUCL 33604]
MEAGLGRAPQGLVRPGSGLKARPCTTLIEWARQKVGVIKTNLDERKRIKIERLGKKKIRAKRQYSKLEEACGSNEMEGTELRRRRWLPGQMGNRSDADAGFRQQDCASTLD